jgi:hypothetical protein
MSTGLQSQLKNASWPLLSLKPVRNGLLQRKCACGSTPGSTGECENCRKKKLQRKTLGSEADPQASSLNSHHSDVPPLVHEVLRSTGEPLDLAARGSMESRFGHDFSGVRIHTDGKAAESSRAVNAVAYTVGHDIAFDAGKYAPGSRTGAELLAHELAHVVQQSRGGAALPNSRSEQAAEQAASDFSKTRSPINLAVGTAPGLARQKSAEASKLRTSITQQAGRTVISVNDVAVAEGDVPENEVKFAIIETPESLDIVIVIPEGRELILIPGANTNSALLKFSSKFRLAIKKKLKSPQRQGELGSLKEYETEGTITGQRGTPPPAKQAVVPPKTPAQVAPPPSATPTVKPSPSFQFSKPPPVSLDLPPSAKYGKPPTDSEIGQERVNKIIRDAIEGRPGTPPPLKGMEPQSLLEVIRRGVVEAVRPLIRQLPKFSQDFLIDKLESAVESGVKGIADAAIDAAQLDGETKAALKKAVEAGIKLKPAPTKP